MAMSKSEIRLAVLIVAWYGCSVMQSIWSKRVLKKLPYPMTLTMGQFGVVCIVMPLLMTLWNKRRRTFTRKQYITGFIPLAALKLCSSLSGFVTLLKVPVSYAHTVKALMPFFTVTLTRVILGDSYSWAIYGSLIPIVGGVLLTTANMVDGFNLVGLIAALSSTLLLSIQSIFSKKAMRGIDHLNLLLGTTQICLATFTPIWLYHEGFSMLRGEVFGDKSTIEVSSIFLELAGASVCNCAQTIVAFTFLSLVQPITYSVANVSKRVIVIAASMITLGEVGNIWNMAGIATTLSGVAMYNKIKLDTAKKVSILPTQHTISAYDRSKYQL